MKLKGYLLSVLSILLLFPYLLFSNDNIQEKDHILHNCIHFVNFQVESLALIQSKLDTFDLSLKAYYQEMSVYEHARLYQEKIGKGSLTFYYPSDSHFDRDVSTSLEKLLTTFSNSDHTFSDRQLKRIIVSLQQLKKLVIKLDTYCLELAKHIKGKHYLKEPELNTARGILTKCEVLFEDFEAEKLEVIYKISQIHARKGMRGRGFPYTVTILKSKNLLINVQQIITAIRAEKTTKLNHNIQKLEETLIRIKNLDPGDTKFPSMFAFAKFQQLSFLGDSILFYVKAYVEDKFPAQWPVDKQKEYYLINEYLVPLYSDPEEGMVAIYNSICEEAKSARLPMVNETKWFIPSEYLPKEPESDPAQYTFNPQTEPMHLILLVDISGSMKKQDKLPLMKKACSKVLTYLRPNDQISLVTFSGTAEVVADSYSVKDKKKIEEVLAKISCRGESYSNEGVMLAYKLGRTYEGIATKQKVVMVTDGGFSINQSLVRLIESQSFVDIPMSVLYVGPDHNEMELRLKKLAYVGGGNFGHARESLFVPYLLLEAGANVKE